MHSSSGSCPAVMSPQTPVGAPVFSERQDRQVPPHASLQHTPSGEQKVLVHWLPAVQPSPFGFSALQPPEPLHVPPLPHGAPEGANGCTGDPRSHMSRVQSSPSFGRSESSSLS